MTFEEYYRSRKWDASFTHQKPDEQVRIYREAVSAGCLSCGLTNELELNALDEGKIYCSKCIKAGHHEGKIKKNKKPEKIKEEEKNLKPKLELNLLESAKVAKNSVSKFPLNELLEVVDFLKGPKEIEHTVRLLNEKIIEEYKKNVLIFYSEKNIKENEQSFETDLRYSMFLGLRSIFKINEIVELMGQGEIKSRNISKSHTWKDLEDEF